MTSWTRAPFTKTCEDVSAGNPRVLKADYRSAGRIPVVDQGVTQIAGYVDESEKQFSGELPVIVFGDHTRRFKFVDFPFAVGAEGVKVLSARPGINSRYLFHYFRSVKLPSAGYSRHFKFLKRVDVPIPSPSEQRRIAHILDRALVLRSRRHKSIVRISEVERSLFVATFGDPFHNAREWPEKPLNTLGSLERGVSKHRPRNDPALLGGPYPLVQTGDVANCDGFLTQFSSSYSEIGLRQSRLWPAGTLCITIAANIAHAGVLTFDACFPDSVVGFTADPVTTAYVRVWLSFLQRGLEETASQSAQKNINLAVLRSLRVPVPPMNERVRFAAALDQIQDLKRHFKEELILMEELFASLQARAFKGEL